MTVRDLEKKIKPRTSSRQEKTSVTKQYLVVSELQLFNKNTFNQFVQEELKRKKSKSNDNQFELKRNKSYDNPLAGWNSKLSLEG